MNPSKKLSAYTLLIAMHLFIASGAVCAEQLNTSSVNSFILGAGDVIEVNVWLNKELSRNLTISPDGTVNYLLIGEMQAAGHTVGELQKNIQGKLKQHVRDPHVALTLIEARSYRIYVMDEVVRPGVFDVRDPVTVVQALAMAGGSYR